jgi:hypothetical protein
MTRINTNEEKREILVRKEKRVNHEEHEEHEGKRRGDF